MMNRNSIVMLIVFNVLLMAAWLTAAVLTHLHHPDKGPLLPVLYLALAIYYLVKTTSKFKMFQQARLTR